MWAAVGWVVIAFGCSAIIFSVILFRRAREQKEWERTPGAITRASVRFDGEYFDAEIEYRYEFHGHSFTGSKLRSLMVSVNWPGPSRRAVEKYPVGLPVVVYVNPKDPRDSVLEAGGDRRFVLVIAALTGITLISGVWLVVRNS